MSFEEFGGDLAHQGEIVSGGAVSHLAVVFVVGDIKQVVAGVLDAPVSADVGPQFRGIWREAAEVIMHFLHGDVAGVALAHGGADHADDALQPIPQEAFGEPLAQRHDHDLASLIAPAVAFLAAGDFTLLRPLDGGQFARMERLGWREVGGKVCGLAAEVLEMLGHGLQGFFLIGLECQNPVTAGSVDLLGNLGVASHGIDADDGRLEFQALQQAGQGGQFVGLVSADGLADAEARLADPSSQQVQTVTACFGIFNSTIDLAIDPDVLACEFADPSSGDLQQRAGLEHHEDIAKSIVRGFPIDQGDVKAQPRELGLGKGGHVDVIIGPGDQREESGEQHIGQRMQHLRLEAWIVKSGELTEQQSHGLSPGSFR